VHEIIGPLTRMQMPQLLEFTRMTGDLIKAMRHCPQPVISSVEGVCAGAGALIALFSDLRYAAPSAKVAFLFVRVGLAGCDDGRLRDAAARDRPGTRRRAALHRPLDERRGRPRLGFFNRVADPALPAALEAAAELAAGPSFAHA